MLAMQEEKGQVRQCSRNLPEMHQRWIRLSWIREEDEMEDCHTRSNETAQTKKDAVLVKTGQLTQQLHLNRLQRAPITCIKSLH